jgi:hypothetical protein
MNTTATAADYVATVRAAHAPWPLAENLALVTIDTHRTVERVIEAQLPEWLRHDKWVYHDAVVSRLLTLERAGMIHAVAWCCKGEREPHRGCIDYQFHWRSVER